jgi:hypothetical protein
MNPFARLLAIGILGFAGFGLFRVVTGPPEIDMEPPLFSSPLDDRWKEIAPLRGMRVRFDRASTWTIPSGASVGVWLCDGGYDVIDGPDRVSNVCALARYE